jgi:hypothetical protein
MCNEPTLAATPELPESARRRVIACWMASGSEDLTAGRSLRRPRLSVWGRSRSCPSPKRNASRTAATAVRCRAIGRVCCCREYLAVDAENHADCLSHLGALRHAPRHGTPTCRRSRTGARVHALVCRRACVPTRVCADARVPARVCAGPRVCRRACDRSRRHAARVGRAVSKRHRVPHQRRGGAQQAHVHGGPFVVSALTPGPSVHRRNRLASPRRPRRRQATVLVRPPGMSRMPVISQVLHCGTPDSRDRGSRTGSAANHCSARRRSSVNQTMGTIPPAPRRRGHHSARIRAAWAAVSRLQCRTRRPSN